MLAPHWQVKDSDTLGEQGLRHVLEQWTHRSEAHQAAAGWAGDRYVVMKADEGWASAWSWRFDTVNDAIEAEAVVKKQFPQPCQERAALGPLGYLRQRRNLLLVAGPYRRDPNNGHTQSISDCQAALQWLRRNTHD